MASKEALAYDIAIVNSDGKKIYYYYINNKTELSVGSSNSDKYSGDIVIPEEVTCMGNTLKVTSIGSNAFLDCRNLTSVTMPNSIKSIELNAFHSCANLTSITIPNSVTSIGESAFNGCIGITSMTVDGGNSVFDSRDNCNAIIETSTNTLVVGCKATIIPNSVTKIGERAFENCTSLTSITIPNNTTNIEFAAFYGCSGLESVNISNGVISIGNYSFYNCTNLTSVTIPNSVTSIGDCAFLNCGLSEIISKIEKPFAISSETFSSKTYIYAKLYIPAGTIDNYKSQDGWKNFWTIEEEKSSAIENIDIEGANIIKRYTLDGRIIKNPQKGINIIHTNNGEIKKILVR